MEVVGLYYTQYTPFLLHFTKGYRASARENVSVLPILIVFSSYPFYGLALTTSTVN